MDKFLIGNIAIIFGGLLLSFEIYGLRIIQGIEQCSGSWQNGSAYATDGPVLLSLCITGAIILYGISLAIQTKKEPNN